MGWQSSSALTSEQYSEDNAKLLASLPVANFSGETTMFVAIISCPTFFPQNVI